MTRDDILAMKPGRELDALVAEGLMGWRRGQTEFGFMPWYPPQAATGMRQRTGGCLNCPAYSTDIAAAWQIVEHMQQRYRFTGEDGFVLACVHSPSPWRCGFPQPTYAYADADTAPEAICKAALLATLEAPHA